MLVVQGNQRSCRVNQLLLENEIARHQANLKSAQEKLEFFAESVGRASEMTSHLFLNAGKLASLALEIETAVTAINTLRMIKD